MRQFQVSPGFSDRIPVDFQIRVGGGCQRDELRDGPACQGQQHAGHGHIVGSNQGNGHQKAAGYIAQQNGHEGAHLDHAVTAGQFSLVECLGQIGKLHGAEQSGVQAHQKRAAEQDRHLPIRPTTHETQRCDQHDHDFKVFD